MVCSERGYCHSFTDGSSPPWLPGKVVCVGRNYADHAAELNNPLPEQPLLFLKPATAMVPFSGTLALASRRGQHHFETEMTLLIGQPLTNCSSTEALTGIAGVGIGLDLTLRQLQDDLKEKRHPWERAKAFDGSCVLSPFVRSPGNFGLQALSLRLWQNQVLVQDGNTADMLFPVAALLEEITKTFSLMPGDVVMTGTPKGVGPLAGGDVLKAELDSLVSAEANVEFYHE